VVGLGERKAGRDGDGGTTLPPLGIGGIFDTSCPAAAGESSVALSAPKAYVWM
jgi:hypothetical protein